MIDSTTEKDGADFDGVVTTSGTQFTHTFEEPGTYRYRCEPHETIGMRGAIIVE